MMAASHSVLPAMPLSELLANDSCPGAATMIAGMQLDSRKVHAGDVFLAVPGDRHDGRQFIEQAVANGAAAVVAEAPVAGFVDEIPVPLVEIPELHLEVGVLASRLFGNPSRAMRMVGVTGTNGKTTTTRLIAQLSRLLGNTCGAIGTLGASLQDDVVAAGNTTPDPVALQRQLKQWRDLGVDTVCMEVSSHALVQGRVNGVAFETAIYTNLSHDHLDYHGTMDAYGRAKLQLFAMEGLRHAVINIDDEFAAQVQAIVDRDVQLLTYSASGAAADVRVEKTQFYDGGVRGQMHTPWGSAEFHSPLPGSFNLANLAAAVTALALAGEKLLAILEAVTQLQPVPGRMQAIPNTLGLQVIVDYAHTPDALEHVLRALKPHVSGALVTVFGCGGDRDRNKRQVMGRVACQLSDKVVVTSDNPRSEEPSQIMRDVESGCSGNYTMVEHRAEAIIQALSEAHAGDCIVIAGKGHEDYQIVQDQRLHFSDAEQARAALARRESQ
ncbi:MAG: UDP-N-acetylmuramoyl-L-alanyl-D-glutamate--2,6-diaminopimelate ligase [Halioglobus sp.]